MKIEQLIPLLNEYAVHDEMVIHFSKALLEHCEEWAFELTDSNLKSLAKRINDTLLNLRAGNPDLGLYLIIVMSVMETLKQKNLLNSNNFDRLLAINIADINHFNSIFYKLESLTQETFEALVATKTYQLPQVEMSTIVKTSRKQGLPRSKIEITQGPTFFLQHSPDKDYMGGGQAVIKEGYLSADDDKASLKIKRIKPILRSSDPIERRVSLMFEEEWAIREVKYQRYYGRKAFCYKNNNKFFIASEWIDGKALCDYSAEQLSHYPYAKRLTWLHSGLKDLQLLHKIHRVHGDISWRNFILNTETDKLSLIDFMSVHKLGSSKITPRVNEFYTRDLDGNDSDEEEYTIKDDMIASGIVFAYLFPELFTVRQVNQRYSYEVHKSAADCSELECQIIELINQIRRGLPSDKAMARCDDLQIKAISSAVSAVSL